MTSLADPILARRRWWGILPTLLLLGTLVGPAAPAYAHPVCTPLDSVTIGALPPIGGTTTIIIPEADVRGKTATVLGKYVAITLNLDTLTLVNLTLRGTSDSTSLTPRDRELITGPAPAPPPAPPPATPADWPKTPDAASGESGVAQLQGALLVQLSPDAGVVLQRGSVGNSMKVQAKNCTHGEVVWIEAGQGTTTTLDLNLSAGLRNGEDEFRRTMFTGGGPGAYLSPSYTYQLNRHKLNGRIDAVGAIRTAVTSTTSRWSLQPGGRVNFVLGEEALEYTLPNGEKVDARTCTFVP
jgi:hypothetical protein